MISANMTGFSALNERLLALGAVAGSKALAKAARKAFLPVIEEARRLAPTDSEALRDAIKVTVKKPKSGDAVVVVGLRIVGPKKQSKKHFELKLRTATVPSRRWHLAEFGTSKQAAQPFIRPAFDRNVSSMLAALKSELDKAIYDAVRKAAKAGSP